MVSRSAWFSTIFFAAFGLNHAVAQQYDLLTDRVFPRARSVAFVGVNDGTQVVANIALGEPKHNATHCYLLSHGSKTIINDPLAMPTHKTSTVCSDINNSGTVLGNYFNKHDYTIGFTYRNGVYTDMPIPEQDYQQATLMAINNRGDVAGGYVYYGASNIQTAFVIMDGHMRMLPNPVRVGRTIATGLNNAETVVVQVIYRGRHKPSLSFLLDHGKFTQLVFPGASCTLGQKINDLGQVIGTYYDGSGTKGMIYDSQTGIYTEIPVPTGILDLKLDGIDDRQTIVGSGVQTIKGRGTSVGLLARKPSS